LCAQSAGFKHLDAQTAKVRLGIGQATDLLTAEVADKARSYPQRQTHPSYPPCNVLDHPAYQQVGLQGGQARCLKESLKMSMHSSTSRLSSPWVYFAVTFSWTWFFWGLAIVLGLSSDTAGGVILQLLGVIGPMVTGIAFTHLTSDKEGRRDYWIRIIDPRRIGIVWFLAAIPIAPALSLIGALLDILLGGTGATWGEAALQVSSNPLAIIPSVLFASLIPFIEELGWRGYVLDRMQSKWSALVSSLILGAMWSLWHLPLFFIEGSHQQAWASERWRSGCSPWVSCL
jgi:membrane protease YdiL (CAAX protease family)